MADQAEPYADTVVMPNLWCKDFPDALSCCDSCHDDFNQGYDQHFEFDMGGGVVALVCCHVLRWLEEQATLNDGLDVIE